ncbi:MAG: hypothetical protein HC802_11550 [Caldilineaceae bacterium]|nr:hypothetical protein [Caldilineaceae bacterium]
MIASPTFLTEAFEALEAEERSLVETPDNGYLLVMVRGVTPSELLALDTIRDIYTLLYTIGNGDDSLNLRENPYPTLDADSDGFNDYQEEIAQFAG